MEIRKLPLAHKKSIGTLLINGWKDVMGLIPSAKNPSKPRFTSQDILAIEKAAESKKITGMEALMEEWGTMGKLRRPNVTDLLRLCLECDQIAAASYIHDMIMDKGPISPEQVSNVIASIEESTSVATETEELILDNHDQIDEMLENSGLLPEDNSDFLTSPVAHVNALGVHNVPFSYLKRISNEFSAARQIGEGGFSIVYLGITVRSKQKVAIKKLKVLEHGAHDKKMIEQLNNEVDQLPRLKHRNIIDLLGYSNDNTGCPCLIYPFMENGTLDKKLIATGYSQGLSAAQRLMIIEGVARGVNHLHTFYIDKEGKRKPLIHRDIKPSNILLDDNFEPKIADFGLLRYGVSGDGQTMTQTMLIRGTPAYLSPEASRGDVSEKMDVWAFGVVLLEIVSGLPVIDDNRSDRDIVTHAMSAFEVGDVTPLLDASAGWPDNIGINLLNLAKSCLTMSKTRRPPMANILETLQSLS